MAIQENEPITNIDPKPMVEPNGKNVTVKRNLKRKGALKIPISFFHHHFIKFKHLVRHFGFMLAFFL